MVVSRVTVFTLRVIYCPAVASRNLCTGVPRHCKSLTGQERAAARFSCKMARNAAEHPFAQSRVAVGAGNHGACSDAGSDVLELSGHAAGLSGTTVFAAMPGLRNH